MSAIECWSLLRRLPARKYVLYALTCSACCPDVDHGCLGYRNVFLISLGSNCISCDIIRRCYDHFVGKDLPGIALCVVNYSYTNADAQLCFKEDVDACEGIHVQLHSKGLPVSNPLIQRLIAEAEKNNPHNPFSSSGDVCPDPGSATLLNKIRTWIDDCQTRHTKCAYQVTSFNPRRLVRLMQEGACLASPINPVTFAALSYCWGLSAQSMTTKCNLVARYSYLDIGVLPQTLQDALIVARGLGLEYIWIDSLCIVQDDEEDWAREAFCMFDTYSCAHVVIAATSAKDSAEGFLRPRQAPLAMHCNQSGHEFELRARRNNSHSCTFNWNNTNYPLFKRGWCMQERFLARRIVHFLPGEVYFECRDKRSCECGAFDERSTARTGSEGCQSFRRLMTIGEEGNVPEFTIGQLWSKVVHEYSGLDLTFKKDTLPALQGIARTIGGSHLGRYMAGLWEQDLTFQLGWRRKRPEEGLHRQTAIQDTTLDYPTFSWISSPDAVWFGLLWKTAPVSVLCTLVDYSCVLASNHDHGAITNSTIRLNGRSVSALETVFLNRKALGDLGRAHVHIDSGHPFFDVVLDGSQKCLDRLESALDWSLVVCFGLYEQSAGDEFKSFGITALLLQRTSESGTYVRVGLVDYLRESWYNEHAFQDIVTII
jgi:hypothetical protein